MGSAETRILMMIAGVLTASAVATAKTGSAPQSAISRITPPEHGFYAKVIDCGGVMIKAPAEVSDAAIREAARRISRLLEHIPTVRQNLVAVGAEHHIIGKDQQTSDLPEWRQMKGKMHWDGSMSFDLRTRGMGGLVSSSGEENLLKLPTDRYKDHRDICSHEFSHGILSSGVSPDVVRMFEEQRKRSTAKGLWTSYAGTNTDEFFAELTMWYFGTRGDFGTITPKPLAGRVWLRNYDPEAYALFDAFYNGRIPVKKNDVVRVRLMPGMAASSSGPVGSQTPSTVIVDNRTDASIKTFTIEADGSWKEVDTIPPDGKYDNGAVTGQTWKVTDERGTALGYFTARGGTSLAIVEPPVVTRHPSSGAPE